jgi:hypothetical protein
VVCERQVAVRARSVPRPRLFLAGEWRGAFQEIRLQQEPLGRSELGACLGVQQAGYAAPRR